MTKIEKISFLSAAFGSVTGSFLWIFLIGAAAQMLWACFFSILCTAAGIYFPYKLYKKNSLRLLSAAAVLLIWIIMVNIIAINCVYDYIPDKIGSIDTGKNLISLKTINCVLALILIFPILMVVFDIYKIRKGQNSGYLHDQSSDNERNNSLSGHGNNIV
jgi:hypothetical protein